MHPSSQRNTLCGVLALCGLTEFEPNVLQARTVCCIDASDDGRMMTMRSAGRVAGSRWGRLKKSDAVLQHHKKLDLKLSRRRLRTVRRVVQTDPDVSEKDIGFWTKESVEQ
jgi:hypothetical protein